MVRLLFPPVPSLHSGAWYLCLGLHLRLLCSITFPRYALWWAWPFLHLAPSPAAIPSWRGLPKWPPALLVTSHNAPQKIANFLEDGTAASEATAGRDVLLQLQAEPECDTDLEMPDIVESSSDKGGWKTAKNHCNVYTNQYFNNQLSLKKNKKK